MSERFSIGNGGWTRYQRDTSSVTAFIRFGDHGGRLVIFEEYLVVETGQPLLAEEVKEVPRRRITSWANEPRAADVIRAMLDVPGPDLHRAAAYFSTSFGPAEPDHWNPKFRSDHWVAESLRAQLPGGKQAPWPKSSGRAAPPPEPVDPKLDVPDTKRFPDDFYRQVLKVVAELEALGTPAPAKVIAEANKVPHARVRQWIAEGRRRRGGR